MQKWKGLSDVVEEWAKNRHSTFDPFWYSGAVEGSGYPVPQIWFSADWHGEYTFSEDRVDSGGLILVVMAFGFYHLAHAVDHI
jgi:hypothetical protein